MPSTRRQLQASSNEAVAVAVAEKFTGESEEEDEEQIYMFEGVQYPTYQDMVDAKRQRNQQVLNGLGFAQDGKRRLGDNDSKKAASQRGLKKKKTTNAAPTIARKSTRLSGVKTSHVALDYNVVNWTRDNTVVRLDGGVVDVVDDDDAEPAQATFFKGRVNDGSNLTLEQAIDLNEPKWIHDDSVDAAAGFQEELVGLDNSAESSKHPTTNSPTSTRTDHFENDAIQSKINDLSIDKEEWVAKVTPDRIYSVAVHPSEHKLIACAGDKQGYVGLWDVDAGQQDDNSRVHLFRLHSRPICCLEWATPQTMISASYDGTVRRFDVEKGVFEEAFATYDDSDSSHAEKLGYGLDQGYRYWLQYATLDHRYGGSNSPCMFLSTSVGTALHLDLRSPGKQRITFHEKLSEKKINSLSLHPNGHALASGGLDGVVRVWDIRKFGSYRGQSSKKAKALKPLGIQAAGLSISSSFFSPSGDSLLTTSFANRLDWTEGVHNLTGKKKAETITPTHSIRHNNQTGRWLTTFMPRWHPSLDICVSGSMNKPRCMEIFDAQGKLLRAVTGDSLGSVMSRCCFHPSADRLTMIGGNSSGRVVAIR